MALQNVVLADRRPNRMNTYSSTIAITPASAATDIATLIGSTSKAIKVHRVELSGTQTTAGLVPFSLIKRSTTNTGGTSTAGTAVPHDSAQPAATGVVANYSANPSGLGTSVGTLKTTVVPIPAPASAVGYVQQVWDMDADNAATPFVLHGVAETLALSLNGATLTGGALYATFIWSEE